MSENKENITYEDFTKLDLRTAKIIDVEEIEGADKLYKLTLEVGEETRTICAGIKEFYPMEELKGRTIIYLYNLEPRKLRGVESQGMLLAANSDGKPILLSTASDSKSGSIIG